MKDKELIWLPVDMVKRLKEVEDKEELMEKEVISYIDKTKRDISGQVELLDDDILQFKAKLSLYKKAFKEAYESADTEMYAFWEDLDNKLTHRHKSLRDRTARVTAVFDREYEKRSSDIDSLYKRLESFNAFQFEKIISFLKQFNSLDDETKDLFKGMVSNES